MKDGADSLMLIRSLRRQRERTGQNEMRRKDVPLYLCRIDARVKAGEDLTAARRAGTRVIRGRKNNRDTAQEDHKNQKNKQYLTDLIHKVSLPCSQSILKPGKICPLF